MILIKILLSSIFNHDQENFYQMVIKLTVYGIETNIGN